MRIYVSQSSTPAPWRSSSTRVSFLSLCVKSLFVLSLTATLGIAQTPNSSKKPLSPEALATMLRAKRAAVKQAPSLEPRLEEDSSTSSTFNSAQGPGPGQLGRDQVAICFRRLHQWGRPYLFHTSALHLPRRTQAWWDQFSS